MLSARIISLLTAAVANMFTPVAFGPTTGPNASLLAETGNAPIETQLPSNSALTLTLNGWLPYWAVASGTKEVLDHRDYFTTISPFSLEVGKDGSLTGQISLTSGSWKQFGVLDAAHSPKVVPTIAWFDPERIDTILSSPMARSIHVAQIVSAVKHGGYDGIDIDYEGKWVKTRDAYSAFIKELSTALAKNGKILQCTVEARTPAEDRAGGVPGGMAHANDYTVLNRYCDTVRIMAYDQQGDDRTLVRASDEPYYFPIADSAWVEKTIKEAIYEIDRRKIVLGIPTYGYVMQATSNGGRTTYKKISAIDFGDAARRAIQYHQIPMRNASGELQYGYMKDGAQYYVSYTDAVAIKQKLLLAQKYGLNGVSIFKFDGGMDPRTWGELSLVIKRT